MRIKTFEATTLQEALALAKNELGEDAVVLNTKHIKAGGILGMGGAMKVELMAAVDDPVPEAMAPAGRTAFGSYSGMPEARPAAVVPEPAPNMAAAVPFAARAYAGFTNPAPAAQTPVMQAPVAQAPAMQMPAMQAPVPESDADLKQLRAELKQLTSVVQGIMTTSRPGAAVAEKSLLSKLGIDEDLARNLLVDINGIDDPYALTSALAARMQAFAMPPVLSGRQVIAVVGPTGVGKTTTLAKLAARFALEQGKKVALVTADTFRIGAVEQLRTYARIMDVPLEIAMSPEEVVAGVERHRDKDVVLIDTVGRSQRSDEHLVELKSFLDAAQPTQTYLVVAASLGGETQAEVVERFALLSPTRLVITKLDECAHRGSLVNLPLRTGLGISCTTAGQNVPQDIEFADAGRIARLVTGVA